MRFIIVRGEKGQLGEAQPNLGSIGVEPDLKGPCCPDHVIENRNVRYVRHGSDFFSES